MRTSCLPDISCRDFVTCKMSLSNTIRERGGMSTSGDGRIVRSYFVDLAISSPIIHD